jgi:hypothetical protein
MALVENKTSIFQPLYIKIGKVRISTYNRLLAYGETEDGNILIYYGNDAAVTPITIKTDTLDKDLKKLDEIFRIEN